MGQWGWIPIALIFAAMGFYVLARIFGSGDKGKQAVAAADAEAIDIKAKADARLQAELEAVESDKKTLEEIKEITNEEERLKALADFANRSR